MGTCGQQFPCSALLPAPGKLLAQAAREPQSPVQQVHTGWGRGAHGPPPRLCAAGARPMALGKKPPSQRRIEGLLLSSGPLFYLKKF